MAEWRKLQYVPDSDDEEDSQEVPTSKPPQGTSTPADQGLVDVDGAATEQNEAVQKKTSLLGHTANSQNFLAKGKKFYVEVKRKNVETFCREDRANTDDALTTASHREPNAPSIGIDKLIGELSEDELQQDRGHLAQVLQLNGEVSQTVFHEADERPQTSNVLTPKDSIFGVPSSPLTEPPSTPLSVPSQSLEEAHASQRLNSPAFVELPQSSPSDSARDQLDVTENRIDQERFSTRPSRSLRQRNPIQLHPYALENQIYRQTFKARGLKPVHLKPAEIGENEEESDTEESSLPNGDNQNSSPRSESSAILQTRRQSPINQSEDFLMLHEEDFPDVSVLLRQASQGTVNRGVKRQKVQHTYSRDIRKRTEKGKISSVTNSNENLRRLGEAEHILEDVFRVPTSPPLSDSASPNVEPSFPPNVFRNPFTLPSASLQMQTPMPSSALSKKSRGKKQASMFRDEIFIDEPANDINLVEVLSSSEEDEQEDDEVPGHEYDDAGEREEEEEAEEEIHHVQRKIRGVLPASWLRLDLKNQAKFQNKSRPTHRDNDPPIPIGTQRGVARPTARSKPRDSRLPDDPILQIEVSDDSLDENERLATSSELLLQEASREDSYIDSIAAFPDIMEDNSIDLMLPPKTRSPTAAKRIGSRSSKFQAPKKVHKPRKDYSLFRRQSGGYSIQPKISNLISPQKTTEKEDDRPLLSRLGVLDVPMLTGLDEKNLPFFVRVARRTARLRPDAGRHSPSGKHLRLATRHDTADVQRTLESWRSAAGSNSGSTHGKKNRHKPLSAISGNAAPYPRSYDCRGKENSPRSDRKTIKTPFPQNLQKVKTYKKPLPLSQYPSRTKCESDQTITKGLQGNSWPKMAKLGRGPIVSSVRSLRSQQPALLERQSESDARPQARRIQERNFPNTSKQVEAYNPLLARYLGTESPLTARAPEQQDLLGNKKPTVKKSSTDSLDLRRRRRKRSPQHLDTSVGIFEQDNEPILFHDNLSENSYASMDKPLNSPAILSGLGPFGTEYDTFSEIIPLPTGSHFEKDTFIGAGGFSATLATSYSELESERTITRFNLSDESYQWGPWNELVSSQASLVSARICQILDKLSRGYFADQDTSTDLVEALYLQESIIRYVTYSLSFLDPIDRVYFLQKFKGIVDKLVAEVSDLGVHPINSTSRVAALGPAIERFVVQFLTRICVTANQLHRVAQHGLIDRQIQTEIKSLLATVLYQTLGSIFRGGLAAIRGFLQDRSKLKPISYNGLVKVEAFIVSYHIAKQDLNLVHGFWATIECIAEKSPLQLRNVQILDRIWLDLFTLLPLSELDPEGTLQVGKRYEEPLENWPIVKRLLDPIHEVYKLNPMGQSSTFNAYHRAASARCFYLIKHWGWYRCEAIIGALFDFHAQNKLGSLQHEENHGSPPFLEHLQEHTMLEIAQRDRSFHIFLKIIGIGLRGMRRVYPPKKIHNVAWRLMPNHGRTHPKEEDLSQEDLDALRNHHDLLSTLYWALLPAFRPQVRVIQNLVYLETSHRATCHISIRTWSNLIRYQLSTGEPTASLGPFKQWFEDFIAQILQQHELARTEVETQAKLAEFRDYRVVTRELQERIIAQNQRQVEALLSDALLSIGKAVTEARSLDDVRSLHTNSISTVFALFNPRRQRSNAVIIQALDVFLNFCSRLLAPEAESDSQDFGDWSGFEDVIDPEASARAVRNLQETMLDPLSRLMSDCFGAEASLDEELLTKLVETWIAVGRVAVRLEIRTWSDYLSPYGHDSWKSLRDTEQTRRFAPYFLATIIVQDDGFYKDQKTTVLTYWVESLMEIESLLKFQHLLTAAILNADRDNPLLANLPFWTDPVSGKVSVSISEFRERRLSLISSILANLRESLDFRVHHDLAEASVLRIEYIELLKQLMTAMKHKYQELGHGSNIRSAYVQFVHNIVGFLQQHTADICPVDRFFTDPSTFPLPAKDPTYIVGRLRNYGLRLQDPRIAKQLSSFIQGICGQAVVDAQQASLVDQLGAAMSNNFETGAPGRVTFRSFLMQAVFPAYIEVALDTSCGWLLLEPLLQAMKMTFRCIFQDINGCSVEGMKSVATSASAFVESFLISLRRKIDRPASFEDPTVLKSLRLSMSAISGLFPILDYIARLPLLSDLDIPPIASLMNIFNIIGEILAGTDGQPMVQLNDLYPLPQTRSDGQITTVKLFTLSELRRLLDTSWIWHDGRCYVAKGSARIEVAAKLEVFEKEKELFILEATRFRDALNAYPSLREEDDNEIFSTRPLRACMEEMGY